MTSTSDYTWIENFARIPDTPSSRFNGRTHGVAFTRNKTLIVFHQAANALLTYAADGEFISAVGGDRWLGAHGLTRVEEDGTEYLWLTDQASGEVVKVTLQGETVQTIDRAPHPAYEQGGTYSPTWAAQNPDTGEIWVADGYGSSLVHRYTVAGQYRSTLDGTEGVGRFNCPHGINFRSTAEGPELWITDRGNRRVTVYSGQGCFLRQTGVTHSPCGFDFLDDLVVIPELFTGVKILRADSLECVAEMGSNDAISADGGNPEGWPDLAGTPHIQPGRFNSPHGACFAPNGDIFCVEWIIGGRITRLQRKR